MATSTLFIQFLKQQGIYKEWKEATDKYRTNIKPRMSFNMRMRKADKGEIKPNEMLLWCFDKLTEELKPHWPHILVRWEAYYEANKNKIIRTKVTKLRRTI